MEGIAFPLNYIHEKFLERLQLHSPSMHLYYNEKYERG